jgi:hypothetical protein
MVARKREGGRERKKEKAGGLKPAETAATTTEAEAATAATAAEVVRVKKRRCSLCKRQVDEYITIQKIGGKVYLCHDCWMKSKLFVHGFTSITNPKEGGQK